MQVDDGAHAVRVDGGHCGQVGGRCRHAEAPPREVGQFRKDGAVVAPPRQYLANESNQGSAGRIYVEYRTGDWRQTGAGITFPA